MAHSSSKNRVISPEVFELELQEILRSYTLENGERVDELTHDAVRQLVKLTRQIAPVGRRKQKKAADEGRSHFFLDISYKKLVGGYFGASRYLWFVKPPNYRLTHLLAKPHKAKNSRMIQATFDLSGALETVLKDYEENIRRYFAE